MKKKVLSMILALVMIITCLMMPTAATSADAQTSEPQETMLQEYYTTADGETHVIPEEKDTTETRIMVAVEDGETVFLQTSDLELATTAMADQRAELYAAEAGIESALGMAVEVEHYFSLLFNGFSFVGEAWMIDAINQIDGLTATEAIEFQLIEPVEEEEVVDLTPQMATSVDMTGATYAWDVGYTGEGMVVGVIDSGIKQTHEAFSVAPANPKIDQKYLAEVFEKYGDVMHGENPEGAYYSAKMPYNWDYWDDDEIPNHTYTNHGSHVAGIVAGNNGDDFKGIAPDAQIISLQIFNKQGGAAVDDMMAAMEDCVYLGVDAINMSLGIANGFETYQWPANFAPVYEALEKAGVAICVAAGNDAHSYISTSFGNWQQNIWQWSSLNPDNSLMGCPGTYVGSFTVGNTTNVSRADSSVLKLGMKEFVVRKAYYPQYTLVFDGMAAGEYEIVNAGYGSPDDYAAIGDMTGKIALVKKGGIYNGAAINYSNKATNAQNAGAIAVVVYNDEAGELTLANPRSYIYFGTLNKNAGEAIIAAMGKGNSVKVTLSHEFSYLTAMMVNSSSWGPNVSLTMKPDISAPGNKIISVDGTAKKADDAYTSKTGTSMATPAVAGGILLLKQHLKTLFPDATAPELTELAYAFMMSTAGQATAFVRQQGAGVMDLVSATETKAYLTTTDNDRPKLELDDSENGEFTFSFDVHNYSNVSKTYDIAFTALTEETSTLEYQGYHTLQTLITADLSLRWGHYWLVNPTPETVTVCNGSMKDVTDWCKLEGTKAVTVKGGETVTLTFKLKAGEELMKYFEENCPDGMYLEGWIKLIDRDAENGVDLSIPYLGFVGDWDYPAVIDDGWWWQDEYGVNNMAQLYVSNVHGGTFLGYGDAEQGLGLNYYWDETGETYLADRNAISPNGDGMLDALTTIEFSLLRQPRRMHFYLEYADGSTTTIYDKSYSFRKETHPVGMASSNNGLGYSGLYWDYDASNLEENETAYYVVEAYLDRDEFTLEGNKRAVIRIPFTKDTIAPAVNAINGGVEIVDTNYVAYYAIYADAQKNQMVYEDGIFATERGVAETYMTDMDEYFVAVADYARNEAFYYVKDGVVYEMDAEGFDHGRTIIGESWLKYKGSTSDYDKDFAWYSVTENLDRMPLQLTSNADTTDDIEAGVSNSDILAVARTADGKVYASSMQYLYSFDPVTFEKEIITRYEYEGESRTAMYAFDVAPGTNNLYGIVSHSGGVFSKTHFVSIDPETGELTRLWDIKLSQYKYTFDFYDADTIILKGTVKANQSGFVLINIADGTVEELIDCGLTLFNPSGSVNKTTLGGHVGYTSSILYDDENNCVYLGGNWSYNRNYRSYENIIAKVDLETGNVTYMQTGMNKGIGLMSLYFEEDVLPAAAAKCAYYRQEVAPTCTTEGYTLHICADCGHEYRDNIVPALGHAYDAVVTEPTCTSMGYTTYTCTVCGDTYVDDYVKATEHPYTAVVIEPTCTEAGYTMYICNVCGDSYMADVTNTVPHSYEAYVVESTCDDFGYTIYTCTVCGDSYTADYTEPSCPAENFTDVTVNDWYHEAVDFVVENGLMKGMTETVFAPNANMTRAQLVTVLYRLAGEPTVEGMKNPFADVPADAWFADAVIWAYNEGVVNGMSDTVFAPNANVTREQLVTILYRFNGEDETDTAVLDAYTDADAIADWAEEAFAWAVENGLITGMTEDTLAPQGTATRAQIATILMRCCQ